MPIRHSFRRRALSNGIREDRPTRKGLLIDSPPPPLPFLSGLNLSKRGGSSQISSSANVFDCDDYAPGAPKVHAHDDTTNEVYASIWRPSLCDQNDETPPTSPSRFLFAQSSASASRQGVARIRQGSLKKCFTPSAFPGVSSLLRWRGKRDKRESSALGSTSFLDVSASKDELPLHPPQLGQLRHTTSEWPLFTPPRSRCRHASGSNSTTTVSPSLCQTPGSSASSSLLFTPDSTKSSSFASDVSFAHLLRSHSSSSDSPPLPRSSSSLLIEPYQHSPLHAARSFEKLRGSLAWITRSSMASRPSAPPSASKRSRNRAGLPPLSPPPTEQLPLPPSSPQARHNHSKDSLQPTFLQWERELKDLSITLHEGSHWNKPSSHLRVNQSIKRSIELDRSTPSTVTPSVLTPRAEAFEFDLDDSNAPSPPAPRLSPKPVLSRNLSTSAQETVDSSFTQAVQSFPTPPLRCRSSSVVREGIDQSSASFYSADSDVDPFRQFSTSPTSQSSGVLASSPQSQHIDILTASSQSTASLYTLASDRFPLSSDDQQ
jgi:hypothetical protein